MSDRFEQLNVFRESHKLTLLIYALIKKFPSQEKFILSSQLTRACLSVTANIIEGNARGHKKEFLQFLYIANGSLEETKYFLLLSYDLGYISKTEYDKVHDQAEKVGKMLRGLIKSLQIHKS